jgi:hypothetical protein
LARGLRVILKPIGGSRPGTVVGGVVGLERRGSDTTKAQRGSSVPGKLTFIAACFATARKPEPKEAALGSVHGKITLSEGNGTPTFEVFASDNPDLFKDPPPTNDAGEKPRTLRLDFGGGFKFTPGPAPPRLYIPLDLSEGARHLELFVELEVAGALEAPESHNDILDVPLTPRPRHLVRLVDEIGEPLSGVPAVFEGGGISEAVTTDAEGQCAIDDLGIGGVTFRITDDASVRATLKERWNQPRAGGLLAENAKTAVLTVKETRTPVAAPAGHLRIVSIQPAVTCARLLGMHFDVSKSFLLPAALPDLRSLKQLYEANPESELLLVGHTDTTGEPDVNDPLSLERAESVAAFLKDDADVWVARYGKGIPEKRRWGESEDFMMLQSLEGFFERPEDEDAVTWFQKSRGLKVDGIAGPETRKKLVQEYMAEDETTLPSSVTITAHGCGEAFPLGKSSEGVDSEEAKVDALDRRVELYFFDKEFGIQPLIPGKNSKAGSREYPEWRRRSKIVFERELSLSDRELRVRFQADGKPLSGAEYALDVDGRRLMVSRTDGDGKIVQRLPKNASEALIRIPKLGLWRSFGLHATEKFPPVEELLGAQVRLAQLGYFYGNATGKLDELTSAALIGFRKSRGLSAEPVFDGAVQSELRSAYGS